MKCSAIQLSNRGYQRVNQEYDPEPYFTTDEVHSYSFPWTRRRSRPDSCNTSAKPLKITTIQLPEAAISLNTGASLEKWSKKRPRLKSSKASERIDTPDRNFCYESELSLLLHDLDTEFVGQRSKAPSNDSLSNLEYEVHSDIKELWLKSERVDSENENDTKKKKKKKRKKKVISFSLSRPPTPLTEQVIRVDVTASRRNSDVEKKVKKIVEVEEEVDVLVKCRRLALENRKRGCYKPNC